VTSTRRGCLGSDLDAARASSTERLDGDLHAVRVPWWRPRCGECRHRLHPPHEPHSAKESRDVREVAIALPPLSTSYASSHGQPWQEGDSGRPRAVGAPWLGGSRGSELEALAHFLPLERESSHFWLASLR
jgi:hypothetical protein